ncbi:MAG: hypothetical protein HY347_07345 [candidate division NC10 bacterium]|nr:hypothetical protein [candidate division NC10 bacterium]
MKPLGLEPRLKLLSGLHCLAELLLRGRLLFRPFRVKVEEEPDEGGDLLITRGGAVPEVVQRIEERTGIQAGVEMPALVELASLDRLKKPLLVGVDAPCRMVARSQDVEFDAIAVLDQRRPGSFNVLLQNLHLQHPPCRTPARRPRRPLHQRRL